jgi:hypothetical protein
VFFPFCSHCPGRPHGAAARARFLSPEAANIMPRYPPPAGSYLPPTGGRYPPIWPFGLPARVGFCDLGSSSIKTAFALCRRLGPDSASLHKRKAGRFRTAAALKPRVSRPAIHRWPAGARARGLLRVPLS